ncbi:MAG: 30S ribosomal protein S14 [Sphingobacteriales bacterium BACL12 MAG-120813-bin55]|jgi:small subunit ribosomal protein S14|nr:MAG: 30S ribosomal protein S14 [Sphingobacteriales bacterium BACL12 MAG-120802-bin5]KRP11434.1 MAG: 30S ribosomal protein S14 [Sphingobacteriales bacterium BACL12 MAG-120813-bin55]
MAKKSIIARNAKRERLVALYAERRAQLKSEGLWEDLDKLPRNSSKVRLRNRCQITGRPRGYISDFGVCRNVMRDLALYGKIPGMKKASW